MELKESWYSGTPGNDPKKPKTTGSAGSRNRGLSHLLEHSRSENHTTRPLSRTTETALHKHNLKLSNFLLITVVFVAKLSWWSGRCLGK